MKIKFKDRSYHEKRKILRQYYGSNLDVHKAVKLLAFRVKQELTNPIIDKFFDYETIISYLVDGYLAFTKEKDDQYIEKDPCNLKITTNINGEFIWEELTLSRSNEPLNSFKKNEVIYISYYNAELSFAESLYTGLIDVNDINFILNHTDFVINALSKPFLNIEKIFNVDKSIIRAYKIQKLKKNI